MDIRDEIRANYFSTGGLWSATKMAKKFGYKVKDVKEVLKGLEIYQRTATDRRGKRKFQKIISKEKNEGKSYSMQFDLYDFAGQSKRKKMLQGGYRYLLGCIDTYSRKVWLYPMKTKTEKELLPKLKEHYEQNPYRNFTADRESAWTSNK